MKNLVYLLVFRISERNLKVITKCIGISIHIKYVHIFVFKYVNF